MMEGKEGYVLRDGVLKIAVAREPIVASEVWSNLTLNELGRILGLTIKQDNTNKKITFLGMLTAYTEDSQLNIGSFAPSSTGKSYLPLELSALFPAQDVMKLGYTSPQAFFHETSDASVESSEHVVDLSRKIMIFLDQPHIALLERLRPLLSHDEKELIVKITDKQASGGNRTKTVKVIGYPVVLFCSAGQKMDEQEATRMILLSPEMNQEKLRESIVHRITRDSDRETYEQCLADNPERGALRLRIDAIKAANIKSINIGNPDLLNALFFQKHKTLKPRHQRDIAKIMGIAKALALLNLWNRRRQDGTLYANDEDVRNAVELFAEVSECQDYGLSPYVFDIYRKIIAPLYEDAPMIFGSGAEGIRGVTRRKIVTRHRELMGSVLTDIKLRLEVLPALDSAGLIEEVDHPTDRRIQLVRPLNQAHVT